MSRQGIQRSFGRRIAVALASCLGLLALLPAWAAADEIEWMYDPDAVVEIHLGGLSEAELDELELAPDEYVKGTFELMVDGVPKGPLLEDVGIRLKGGAGSGRPVKTGKSGFKVRFDEFVDDQFFFGIKRLTLNNMIQDPSMVHETLTYEIFHALGLPASRTGYAFVTLNDDDYGLFLNLETLDEVSLPQWFGEDNTQHLYEADAPGTDLEPGGAGAFEVDEGDDEDISDLQALIEVVSDEEGDWSENVSPFADLEQMTRAWAVERYAGHWDGYAGLPNPVDPNTRPNNYYLHSDEAGIFQMMPWGTDQTWEVGDIEFDEPAGGIMFNKCLADASCKQLYLEGLADVHCVAPGLEQVRHAKRLAKMLAPYQAKEDEGRRETSEEEIVEGVELVEGMAALRPEQLEEYLTAEGVPDPCPQSPAEGPSGSDSSPPPGPTTIIDGGPHLRLILSRLRGAFVTTRVEVPDGGTVTQRITTRIEGQRRRLCTGQSERNAAGRLAVRCRLPKWALGRLEDGPLGLKGRIRFVSDSGKPLLAFFALSVPRR
jgi:hypothetical protein